jgi:hypothetical protein
MKVAKRNSTPFTFEAQEVPKRLARKGRYEATLENVLDSEAQSVKINIEDVKLSSAYQSFNKVVKTKYPDKLAVHKISDGIYIEKL